MDPSLEEATDVLVSHKLFHAVQATYNAGQPPWLSKDQLQAEWVYNPDYKISLTFNGYLAETERSDS